MVGVTVLAISIPVYLRLRLLGNAPLTDDEGAYEFTSRLLLSGRLYDVSPPLSKHFDIHFMVNNGRYFSHYFLGWPALMAPWVWLGIPKLAGAFYSGALALGLFLVVRRVAGSTWARLGSVVHLTSMLFMVGAATQLSHVPCATAILWLAWVVLRDRDSTRPWWSPLAVAALFSIAFFIRPMTVLGVGTPFVVYWAAGTFARSTRERWIAWVQFSVIASLAGAAFLAVNQAQNGSPFQVAYQAYVQYVRQNHFAFSPYSPSDVPAVAGFRFDPQAMIAGFAGSLYRVNVGAFGWPSAFLPMALAWRAPRTRVWWWTLAWYAFTNSAVEGVGIDTLGPIKATEISLVILVLAMAGLGHTTELLERKVVLLPRVGPRFPFAVAVACVALGLLAYAPPRLAAIARVAHAVTVPERTLAAKGIDRALVFVGRRRVPLCASFPTRHFVLQRPYNSPGFRDPILWVNRLDDQSDAELRAQYADRPAFVQVRDKCNVVFVPFEAMQDAKK